MSVRSRIIQGDCREVMRRLAEDGARFDSIVTDPPYHLTSGNGSKGFMGKEWDGGNVAFDPVTWALALDLLKPGGYLLAFGGSRTYHRMACAIEDAGFEIRDQVINFHDSTRNEQAFLDSLSEEQGRALGAVIDDRSALGQVFWKHGQGFPKNRDVSKAIDEEAGAKREVVGRDPNWRVRVHTDSVYSGGQSRPAYITAPATDDARQWQGFGTALKPAHEPIVLARKPIAEKSVAANVLAFGTGALNIDATRVPTSQGDARNSLADSRVCTCSEREASRSVRNGSIRSPASASSGRGEPASLLASVARNGRGRSEPGGSQAGCLTDRRSDDERAHQAEGSGPGALPSRHDEDTPHDRCAKCGRIRGGLTKPSADNTTPNVEPQGRWPANVVHDGSDEVEAAFAAFGELKSGGYPAEGGQRSHVSTYNKPNRRGEQRFTASTGTASRFYYCAKASKADRDDGLEGLPEVARAGSSGNNRTRVCLTCGLTDNGSTDHSACGGAIENRVAKPARNHHPTVKPTPLMRYLCRLVTPPGGTILDPFCGSGSTGRGAVLEGFNFVGIELDPGYCDIAERRIAAASASVPPPDLFSLMAAE
jgi:DNA modification methylase